MFSAPLGSPVNDNFLYEMLAAAQVGCCLQNTSGGIYLDEETNVSIPITTPPPIPTHSFQIRQNDYPFSSVGKTSKQK